MLRIDPGYPEAKTEVKALKTLIEECGEEKNPADKLNVYHVKLSSETYLHPRRLVRFRRL